MQMALLMVALLGFVQQAEDLHALGCRASELGVPVVLYVSRSDCTYCLRMEREVLGPLMQAQVLGDKALIRELVSDLQVPITDFNGQPATPGSIAARYSATLTPTVLFLNAGGAEVQQKIVGYNGSDFYSYYLERAVTAAAQKPGGPAGCAPADAAQPGPAAS
jgi:hypothetical protein